MPTMNPEQKLMEGSNLVIGILMHRTYRHPLFFLASLKQLKYENTTVMIKIQTETPYNQAKGDSAMSATKSFLPKIIVQTDLRYMGNVIRF